MTPDTIKPAAEWCAAGVEAIGIAIITIGSLFALIVALTSMVRRHSVERAFHHVRQRLGRGILLGLEFLVAADIIHTVAVELTWESVGVLAVIVAIRTFLSFTLELELTGKWPWQQNPTQDTGRVPVRSPASRRDPGD